MSDGTKPEGSSQRVLEAQCNLVRSELNALKEEIAGSVKHHPLFNEGDQNLSVGNLPPTRNANIKANLTLAFRSMEDARMRIGKAMQALEGGVSCYDKEEE